MAAPQRRQELLRKIRRPPETHNDRNMISPRLKPLVRLLYRCLSKILKITEACPLSEHAIAVVHRLERVVHALGRKAAHGGDADRPRKYRAT